MVEDSALQTGHEILTIGMVVVLMSVFAHGITAFPATALYARALQRRMQRHYVLYEFIAAAFPRCGRLPPFGRAEIGIDIIGIVLAKFEAELYEALREIVQRRCFHGAFSTGDQRKRGNGKCDDSNHAGIIGESAGLACGGNGD